MTAQLEVDFSKIEDAGEASALSGIPENVRVALLRAFQKYRPAPRMPFNSDMIWGELTMAERETLNAHPNAVGALFKWHRKAGKIEEDHTLARAVSQRDNAKGRRIPFWRWKE